MNIRVREIHNFKSNVSYYHKHIASVRRVRKRYIQSMLQKVFCFIKRPNHYCLFKRSVMPNSTQLSSLASINTNKPNIVKMGGTPNTKTACQVFGEKTIICGPDYYCCLFPNNNGTSCCKNGTYCYNSQGQTCSGTCDIMSSTNVLLTLLLFLCFKLLFF